jgi:exosome complex component RRP4
VYEGAVELEAEEQSLGGVEKGVGAKGVVEAVLARLAVENAG